MSRLVYFERLEARRLACSKRSAAETGFGGGVVGFGGGALWGATVTGLAMGVVRLFVRVGCRVCHQVGLLAV